MLHTNFTIIKDYKNDWMSKYQITIIIAKLLGILSKRSTFKTNNLKIPYRSSEAPNRWNTDNTMVKRKTGQTPITTKHYKEN